MIVVKAGGNVLEDPKMKNGLIDRFLELKGSKIFVHGGGKSATSLAERLGVKSRMVDGRRITDAATLEVVLMAYPSINKRLVADFQARGEDALGVCGADMGLIISCKRVHPSIDFGFVGDIEKVNFHKLEPLLALNIIPVVCALTATENGDLLNTNADTIAAALASAGTADELIFCFERPGVLADENNNSSVIERLTPESIEEHINAGTISGGMIPKLHNAVQALQQGVKKVRITDYDHLSRGTTIELNV